jgi:RimJ/RimL family protein N-acetyltransferase
MDLNIRLRPVTFDDWIYFFEVWNNPDVGAVSGGDTEQLNEERTQQLLQQLIDSTTTRSLMIEESGIPIGSVELSGKNPVLIQIVIGYPERWGKGIGTAVGGELRNMLEAEGVTWARMYVWEQNERSIALGKKFGFQEVTREIRSSDERVFITLDWKKKPALTT